MSQYLSTFRLNVSTLQGVMQNAKPRLLIAVTQAEWGGVQSLCFRCAKQAIQRGYDVLVVAGGEGELESACAQSNIPYRKLLKMEREISPLKEIGSTIELIQLFREWKPDTIFLHSSKMGVVGSVAGRIARVPRIVYQIGGWSFLDPVSEMQKRIRLWSEKLTAKCKDIIITIHPGDKKLADEYGIRAKKRIEMIPHGIDVQAFDANALPRDVAREKLDRLWKSGIRSNEESDSNGSILLTVAHFYATKYLVRYMDAIALVAKVHPDIRVLILGDGELRNEIEARRTELNLDRIVSLPGTQKNAQSLFSGADLFILPSAKEGMPLVILEAMAASLPCIATDVGACKWMLEKNGWIAPSKNPELLAEAIKEALDNQVHAKIIGQNARFAVEKRFSEKEMWEKTFEILGE